MRAIQWHARPLSYQYPVHNVKTLKVLVLVLVLVLVPVRVGGRGHITYSPWQRHNNQHTRRKSRTWLSLVHWKPIRFEV
jgi:hypothetical protein